MLYNTGFLTLQNEAFRVEWDKSLTSVLLSSYYYGSIVTQIPAGKMADAIGGKLIIFIAFVLTAVCSLLTPICVRTHIALVFVLRILIGLAGVRYLKGKDLASAVFGDTPYHRTPAGQTYIPIYIMEML